MTKPLVPPLTVLSLGAGVQSTALALMCERGDLPYKIDFAVFADTQAEPPEVYSNLERIKEWVSFEIKVVTAGNLESDLIEALKSEGRAVSTPPFFVRKGEKIARLWRQCTNDYKIKVIKKCIRANLEKNQKVIQLIGISSDEAHRMKQSKVNYIENQFPLAFNWISRIDCLRYLERIGYPEPPKSACFFCPFSDTARLKKMRDNNEDMWNKLVAFDQNLRKNKVSKINGAKLTGDLYVHRSGQPINKAPIDKIDSAHDDLFGEECEGMCGL